MAESSLESEKPPHGSDNSMCRPLALRSVTKVPSLGNANSLFHRLSAPTPCSYWCPRLGAAHTPWAARTARVRLCFPRHREPPPGIGAPEAGRPPGSSRTADVRGGVCCVHDTSERLQPVPSVFPNPPFPSPTPAITPGDPSLSHPEVLVQTTRCRSTA